MIKRIRGVYLLPATVLLAVGVVVAIYALSSHFLNKADAKGPVTVDCKVIGSKRIVTIEHDQVMPNHTAGRLCDSLTILNKDNVIRLMAFGPHDHHVAYDGITEQIVGPNQSLKITLNQLGTFHFHDHIHEWVTGSFSVSQ